MGNGYRKTRNIVSYLVTPLLCVLCLTNFSILYIYRLLLLNKLLEDGNILYRKNRLQEAAHRYQYALRKIPSHTTCGEFSSTFLQLKVNFLLNHSRCKRKMNVRVSILD